MSRRGSAPTARAQAGSPAIEILELCADRVADGSAACATAAGRGAGRAKECAAGGRTRNVEAARRLWLRRDAAAEDKEVAVDAVEDGDTREMCPLREAVAAKSRRLRSS